jgi:periplasmic divalent cation tolerance protein
VNEFTMHILELTTTLETESQARELARCLVEQQVAACVQIAGPIHSVYRWKGEICGATEYRLTIKTTCASELPTLDCLKKHHPYETPELLMQQVRVSDEYGQWVQAQVRLAE